MGDDGLQRTLYVGNLDPQVTEEFLITLFSNISACIGCKIIHEIRGYLKPFVDPSIANNTPYHYNCALALVGPVVNFWAGNDLYAFVEFSDHLSAQMALMAMNKRNVLGREMKVNWATSPGSHNKQDTTNHFHIFVGDLSSDIETHQLREAFAPFGEMSECKVIRDTQTQLSKGFGFVSYVRKEDAECAIAGMNGQWLGNKPIRTNWATRKPAVPTQREVTHKTLRYEDVYNQSSPTNFTVYCGGISSGLTEELIQETFAQFGDVQEVRVFKEKGFAFIRYESKKSATEAIVGTHGADINGYSVKCSWGKETPDTSSSSSLAPSASPQVLQQNYAGQQYGPPSAAYYNPMGYYNYPQQYPPMPGYGPPQQPYMPGYGYQYGGYGAQQGQWGGGVASNQGQPQYPPTAK